MLRFIYSFSVFVCAILFICAEKSFSALEITMQQAGLESLKFQGKEYLRNGRVELDFARNSEGGPENFRDVLGGRLRSELDEENRQVTVTYDGVVLVAKYAVNGNRLDITWDIKNISDKPVNFLAGRFLELNLEHNPVTRPNGPGGHNSIGKNNFRRLPFEDADAMLINWSQGSVNTGFTSRSAGPITLEVTPPNKVHHPVVDDRFFSSGEFSIPPGESRQFHVSLIFSEKGVPDSELIGDLQKEIQTNTKMELAWPDRRPIGTLFLAQPTKGWKTNPRGWIFGGDGGTKIDITTPEGLQAFGNSLMELADHSIGILKGMDAQGMIFWDLEGAEFPHAITYIADPEKLPMIAPEMDKFADQFFAKFREAGFRTGITIRPTEVVQKDPKTWWLTHREVKDPVKLMSDKIQYAKNRWGCTIFYLDSNVFNTDWLSEEEKSRMKNVPYNMPVSMIRDLHRLHPDVLIIPEWGAPGYYQYSAPYSHVNLRHTGTSPAIRMRQPGAFSVVSNDRGSLRTHWDRYLQGVVGGDILLFRAWYEDPANPLVKLMVKEAAQIRQGPPENIKTATKDQLKHFTKTLDEEIRYHAAVRLGEFPDKDIKEELLYLASSDESFLVRKAALSSFAKMPPGLTETETAVLLAILGNPDLELLAPAASVALGKMASVPATKRPPPVRAPAATASPATQGILGLLESQDPRIILFGLRAVQQLPGATPEILAALRRLSASPEIPVKEQSIALLGKFQDKESVTALIELLKDPNENVSGAAVGALGNIRDARGIQPVIELYQRAFGTVVVYWIRDAQNDALQKMTGTREYRDGNGWVQWLQQNPQS